MDKFIHFFKFLYNYIIDVFYPICYLILGIYILIIDFARVLTNVDGYAGALGLLIALGSAFYIVLLKVFKAVVLKKAFKDKNEELLTLFVFLLNYITFSVSGYGFIRNVFGDITQTIYTAAGVIKLLILLLFLLHSIFLLYKSAAPFESSCKVIALVFVLGLYLICQELSIFILRFDHIFELNILSYVINLLVYSCLTAGIFFKSRLCSLGLTGYFVYNYFSNFEQLWIYSRKINDPSIIIDPFIIMLILLIGVWGTFKYHAQKQS